MKALMLTQPVGFLLGFVCILFYPITRAKAAETRRLLDARSNAPKQ
jgi:Na+/melibiose symporter-like transporter